MGRNDVDPDYYEAVIRMADGTEIKIEVWDIIRAYRLSPPKAFAAKYILRAGKKDKRKEIEDIDKAIKCLEREKLELLWGIEGDVMREGFECDSNRRKNKVADEAAESDRD